MAHLKQSRASENVRWIVTQDNVDFFFFLYKAIAIEIKHDDKLPEEGQAYFQCALLYTSVSGQRRLRVHNLAFSTCTQLSDLFRCSEMDTFVNVASKQGE